mmetsp:Transcript_4555/g.12733  ORF Transcript_4555/g.12733 Transcript_4555/m.12733 type:complete len:201 (-) Transcript_4555:907-1509(-)
MVAIAKALLRHITDSTNAFCHILSRHLKMHSSWVGSHLFVYIEESPELSTDVLEVSGFVAILCLPRVTMNRIRNPNHRLALALHSANESRKILAKFFSTHADYNCEASRNISRVHGVANAEEFIWCALIRNLHPKGVSDTTCELKMSSIQLTCTFSNPKHMSRTIIPLASDRILTSECLLIREKKALMRSVEVSLGKSWV